MRLFGFMRLRELVFIVFLGMMVAVIAGAQYYFLEWAWSEYADFDRGLWQGVLLVLTLDAGRRAASFIANRKDRNGSPGRPGRTSMLPRPPQHIEKAR